MRLRKGSFTRKEKAFIGHMVSTGDKRYSAEKAGYAVPIQTADKLIAKPRIAAEIARLQEERLFNEVLPAAVDVHLEIMTDRKAPAGARMAGVKLAYDRTLDVQDGKQEKEPYEMTAEELALAIAECDRILEEAAERAKPVQSIEPDGVFS